MTESNGSESVRALARGLRLIEAFGGSRRGKTLADLARDTDLSRATVRRLLLTLKELGYVSTDGRLFNLTSRVLTLSYPYLSSVALTDMLLPHMEEMLEGSSYTSSSAAMLDQSDVVFTAGVPARGLVRTWMTVGLRVPAIYSSMGRIMLSYLPPDKLEAILEKSNYAALTPFTVTDREQIRRIIAKAKGDGFAFCDREIDPLARACAVPIFDRQGRCWAAVSASCHDPSKSMENFAAEFLPRLKLASEQFTRNLPYDPFIS
ncbi:IclR family transcriptional regulator C-terminal domain-containing protein [Agrobacterium sp. LAD9]|uniref:IclR family transcriptional regulator domain-containing protein n=1 Tax=Agrobacterium sp. LAD9 TaxID=2055153 RepID=UPI000D1EB337|nr:IclR family transcriptional regulator C-terminal domain-containing protein [Agrobacterium sp. LAD9]